MIYFIEVLSTQGDVIEGLYTLDPDRAFDLALDRAGRYPEATVTTYAAASAPLRLEEIGVFHPQPARAHVA